MAWTRWTIHDPDTGDDITLPMNPREGALPQLEKTISEVPTTAGEGAVLLWEGLDKAQRFPFAGAILQQAHYQLMVDWYHKRHQVLLTDDLGNQFWVYLISFKPRRRNRVKNRWSMTFDAEALIISWTVAP